MAKTAKKIAKKPAIVLGPDPFFHSFEKDCAQMVVNMDSFLTRNYGKRCREYEAGCCVCDAWKLRDNFKAHACD